MNWSQSYNDICCELGIMQLQEKELQRRVELARRVLWKGEMPSSVYCHIPLDQAIGPYNKAVDDYNAAVDEVDRLSRLKTDMESYMNGFTGLESVVKYKRLQGFSYKEIAAETGYTEGYLRQRVLKTNKKRTKSANVV